MIKRTAKLVIYTMICISTFLISNCATIMYGGPQKIPIKSDPNGSKVISDDGQSCITPCTLNLNAHRGHRLIITAEGYKPETAYLSREDLFGLVLLDCLTVIGGIVDIVSGTDAKLSPSEVNVTLQPQ